MTQNPGQKAAGQMISDDGSPGWIRALLSTTPQHLLQETNVFWVQRCVSEHSAVLLLSAHCESQPDRYHLSLPLQAEIQLPADPFFKVIDINKFKRAIAFE